MKLFRGLIVSIKQKAEGVIVATTIKDVIVNVTVEGMAVTILAETDGGEWISAGVLQFVRWAEAAKGSTA